MSEKLFSGTSSTTFSPEEPMTRGMFVTVLGNKAKIDPKDYFTSSFSDVKAGIWYAPQVEWAVQNGLDRFNRPVRDRRKRAQGAVNSAPTSA